MNNKPQSWQERAISEHKRAEKANSRAEKATSELNEYKLKLEKQQEYKSYLEARLLMLESIVNDQKTKLQTSAKLLVQAKPEFAKRKDEIKKLQEELRRKDQQLKEEITQNELLNKKIATILRKMTMKDNITQSKESEQELKLSLDSKDTSYMRYIDDKI